MSTFLIHNFPIFFKLIHFFTHLNVDEEFSRFGSKDAPGVFCLNFLYQS
jgi:hypothetical protein